MRKTYIATVLVIIVLAVFSMNASPSWAQQKGPIKIGFIAPLTGLLAQVGKDMLNSIHLCLEEVGYQAAGRKIELLVEDDEGIPATALTKGRKLVERDGVHVIAGVMLTPSGYALAPYLDSKEIPGVFNSNGDDQTQRQRAKWVIRVSYAASQPTHPFGEYAYQVLKFRKISALLGDFSFIWESMGGFQRTFEENGGKIIQKIWFPMNATDFSPYIPRISKEADALLATTGGALTFKFYSQFRDFGLKGKIPVIATGTSTDESLISPMGDEILGVITALTYSAALDNPANKKYVKAFRERTKTPPGFYAEASYTGAKWIVEGIKAAQGDVENRSKFLDALKKVELKDTPRGPMRMDAYGNPTQNVYIRKVERVGEELQNTVIYTYPNVSQFWKYKPEEFLKQPVYSRD